MPSVPPLDDDLSKADSIRFQVLRALEEKPASTQRELADRLGISLGRVNYCIQALVAKGQMKVENFKASDHKWRYVYVLTPHGIAERAALTSRFLARKLKEFEALKAEIAALQDEGQVAEASRGAPPVSRCD